MSLLISNKTTQSRALLIEVTDEAYYQFLLDSDEVLPFGTFLRVKTGATDLIYVGSGEAISESIVLGGEPPEPVEPFPAPPDTGTFMLTSVDGELGWEEVE